MNVTIDLAKRDFDGLAFINLVDFDMVYGHRNNVDGYAQAATDFDKQLAELLPLLKEDDILMITADHGNDPTWTGTDHTREYIPLMIYTHGNAHGEDLGTRKTFADIGATIADLLDVKRPLHGKSMSGYIEVYPD